jgi:hypothetical protein
MNEPQNQSPTKSYREQGKLMHDFGSQNRTNRNKRFLVKNKLISKILYAFKKEEPLSVCSILRIF